MVETITPVVHGGRNRSYYISVALHLSGATLSAALFGFVLGGTGALLGGPWDAAGTIAVGAVALVFALRELAGLPIPLPDLDRQVPLWWRTYFSLKVSSFLYGLGLGIGYLTFLSFGTLVPVTVGAVAVADPWLGAALMAPFGAARALGVMLSHRVEPEIVLERLYAPRTKERARLLNGGLLAVTALAAAASVV